MKYIPLILFTLPIVLLFPVPVMVLAVILYILIPIFLLVRHVSRNLHWGELTKERPRLSRSASILSTQKRQEAILKSLHLDPDEERRAREHLAEATLRKLGKTH